MLAVHRFGAAAERLPEEHAAVELVVRELRLVDLPRALNQPRLVLARGRLRRRGASARLALSFLTLPLHAQLFPLFPLDAVGY